MTMESLNIEIEELTPEQAAEIWQEQRKRPANFLQILMYLRLKAIGQAFDVKVDADPTRNEQHARDIRKWFGIAGRERTVIVGDKEVPAPVRINWREQSHKTKQMVVKDGKRGEVEISIIDRLHGKVLDMASAPGRKGGAVDDEQVDDLVTALGPYAAGSKTLELRDGRKAKLTRSGHWRAPKLAVTDADHAAVQGASNGSAEKVAVGAT